MLCREDRVEGEQRRDRAPPHRQTAAERRGALEERAEGRAAASKGINTRSHTGFCSDPEPFISRRRVQSLFFKLLGLLLLLLYYFI